MRPRDSERQSRSLWARMVGSFLLKSSIYERIAEDDFASLQAIQIVLMATITVALSALGLGGNPITALSIVVRVMVVVYALRWIAGQRGSMREPASAAGLQRTMGFAQTPLFITFISAIPILGLALVIAGHLWSMVAMAVAARIYFGGRDDTRALVIIALAGIVPLLVLLFAPSPVPEAVPLP